MTRNIGDLGAKALDALHDLILLIDSDYEVVYANEAVCEFSGLSRDEVEGSKCHEISHGVPVLCGGILGKCPFDVVDEMGAVTQVHEHVDGEGEKRFFEVSAAPVRDEDGEVEYVLESLHDVTDCEEEIRTLETGRLLTEQSLNALHDVFYSVRPDGKPLRWNDELNRVIGYTDEEIAAMSPFEMFEEDEEKVREAFERFVEGEEEVATMVMELSTDDGESVPYEFTATVVEDEEGDPLAVSGMGRDVSERMRMEEELRESEELSRSLVESVPEAMVTANEEREIEEWNKAAERIFGYEADEAEGMKTDILVPEENLEGHVEGFERFVRTGERSFEGSRKLEALRKDGSRVDVEIRYSPLVGEEEPFVTAIITDVSGRVRREEHLKVLNRVIKHDLKNALNVIHGYSQLMAENPEDAERYVSVLEERAEDMIDLLEKVNKVERSIYTEKVETKRVDLSKLLDEMAEKFQRENPHADI